MMEIFDLPINTISTMQEIFALIVLGGLIYFLKQFASSVNSLKIAVEELKIMFSTEKEKLNNAKASLVNIETSFTEIYNRIEVVERDLAVLKFQHSK